MIYLVEDDESIRELVIYTLQTTGLAAKGFPCAKDFWNAMKQEYPSLVLLDIMLPDEEDVYKRQEYKQSKTVTSSPSEVLTLIPGSEASETTGCVCKTSAAVRGSAG